MIPSEFSILVLSAQPSLCDYVLSLYGMTTPGVCIVSGVLISPELPLLQSAISTGNVILRCQLKGFQPQYILLELKGSLAAIGSEKPLKSRTGSV